MQINKILILVVFISTAFAQSYIDVVKLNNGDIIKGKIIENVINDYIRVELQGGSILTYKYDQIESIEVEKKSTRTFGSGVHIVPTPTPVTLSRDCFNDGYASGQSVDTGGAMIGGFLGGFGLGLIGWGISYTIVAGGNPQPPYNEISSMDESCSRQYTQGFRDSALKVKKSSVNIGGALGTLLIVSILLGAQ